MPAARRTTPGSLSSSARKDIRRVSGRVDDTASRQNVGDRSEAVLEDVASARRDDSRRSGFVHGVRLCRAFISTWCVEVSRRPLRLVKARAFNSSRNPRACPDQRQRYTETIKTNIPTPSTTITD